MRPLSASLFAGALVLLPAVLIQAADAYSQRGEARRRAERAVEARTAAITGQVDATFQLFRQVLVTLRTVPSVAAAQQPECTRLFEQVLAEHTELLNVALADAQGVVRCTAVPSRRSGEGIQDRPYFAAIRRNGFTVGEFTLSLSAAAPVLQLAEPVRDATGYPVGVIWLALRLEHFARELQRWTRPGETVVIADRNGIILASAGYDTARVGIRLPPTLRGLAAHQAPGVAVATDVDGRDRLFGFVPSAQPGEGLFFALGQDAEEVYAAAEDAFLRRMVLIGAELIAAVLLALWLSRPRPGRS